MTEAVGIVQERYGEESERSFDPRLLLEILKRRWAYLLGPIAVILMVGTAYVMVLKPIYVAEARILVESQQIPSDLVRSTITATARERIQVIEQRVMTRENLLAIVNKYQLFPEQRRLMSGTQLLDAMRQSSRIQPFELDQARRRGDNLTIALTIAFEYEQPEMAMRVANELVTLILNEDSRNRSSRAQETTNFLAAEVKKLEAELGAVDAQISDFKRKFSREPVSEKTLLHLAEIKAELQEKSAVFSKTHPEIARLTRQVAALEKIVSQAAQVEGGLEALQNQRTAIQRNLENAAQKLSAGRLGESLEKAQFAERLEILEQAIVPQKPMKPNRPKMLAFVFAAAFGAGLACVMLMETLDKTIHSTRDVYRLYDPHLVVAIPYVATQKELLQKRLRAVVASSSAVAAVAGMIVAAHFFVRPLDQLWNVFWTRLVG